MPSLFTTTSIKTDISPKLTNGEKISIYYHNIFDYPLNFADLIKWNTGDELKIKSSKFKIQSKSGFYFVEGKEGTIYKRKLNKRISQRKLIIAKKAADILSFIPTIKMIGITGSLAMENSNEESDIDLMIITRSGSLWTSRLLAYLLIDAVEKLRLFGIQKRSPNDRNQKDKLCLNMWLDENDLVWKKNDRNLYTAHEIAQIVPLTNKDKTYEKFLLKNKWILNYWPNSIEKKYIGNHISYIGKTKTQYTNPNILHTWLENICFQIQYRYMKSKISREVITKTRALFHPQDWGKIVLERLA